MLKKTQPLFQKWPIMWERCQLWYPKKNKARLSVYLNMMLLPAFPDGSRERLLMPIPFSTGDETVPPAPFVKTFMYIIRRWGVLSVEAILTSWPTIKTIFITILVFLMPQYRPLATFNVSVTTAICRNAKYRKWQKKRVARWCNNHSIIGDLGVDFVEGDETFDESDVNAMVGTYWVWPSGIYEKLKQQIYGDW